MITTYQKNALLTLNQHIATIVPEAEIQIPTIKSIASNHLSTHQNILTSSIDLVTQLPDEIINMIVDEISGFVKTEYDVSPEQSRPFIKSSIDSLVGNSVKMSAQKFKQEMMGQVSTLSPMIQLLMSDDIMDIFSGGGIDTDKLSQKIASKLDKYIPNVGGFDLSSNGDFIGQLLDSTVQGYLSTVQNPALKNNMGDLYNIIKKGEISQSELSNIIHDSIDKISPYAKTFVSEWGGFSQMVDTSLDPIGEMLFKDSMCFKTNSNILKQLKNEYEKSVDAQSINLQTNNSNKGFVDPDFKFPPPKGTLTPFNSTFQVLNTIAMSTPPWTTATGKIVSQPTTTKNSKYPHNTKDVSTSGHIHEVDDTPGHERIFKQHKSGTMEDIDAGGNLVKKIVGDNYTIIDKNGYIFIEGSCDVVANGSLSIKTSNALDLQVVGDANIAVHGSASVGVGNDCSLSVANLFSVNAGDIAMYSHGDVRIKADGEYVVESVGDASIKSSKNIKQQAGLSINNKAGKDVILEAGKSVSTKSTTFITNASTVGIKSSGDLVLNGAGVYASGSSVDVKASGALNMDGGVSYWQSGHAGSKSVPDASAASSAESAAVKFGEFKLEQIPLCPPYIENTPRPTQFDADNLPFNGDVP